MTLHDFIRITRHIEKLEVKTHGIRPNAICVSRHLYEELKNQVNIPFVTKLDDYGDAICGLAVFVDDDAPDDYYQVGQAKIFIDMLKAKNRIKKLEGV